MADARSHPRVQFITLLQFQHELNEVMMRSLDLDQEAVHDEVAMWARHVREELDELSLEADAV